ncbi:sigma-70 family RNA polymerase sigma factor [Candidatus Dojkabacteria bacterium]|nr:sigma-70 family RNA polymerase sigma factor [Candidatus Dojkabacteria bacterium]
MKIKKIENATDFKSVFYSFNKKIYKYIFLRIGYRKALAEDMTQEVFMKVWEKRELYNTKKSFKTWIYTIARNLLIDFYRKQDTRKKYRKAIDEIELNSIGQDADFDCEIIIDYVLEKMNELSEAEKELIILRYIEQLEIEEIAEIINHKYDTTKVYINRALHKLQEILKQDA